TSPAASIRSTRITSWKYSELLSGCCHECSANTVYGACKLGVRFVVPFCQLGASLKARLRAILGQFWVGSENGAKLGVYRLTLRTFLFSGHNDVGYLHRGQLTRQRKHLVHSYSGSDRCIAQAGLTDSFLHALHSEFS